MLNFPFHFAEINVVSLEEVLPTPIPAPAPAPKIPAPAPKIPTPAPKISTPAPKMSFHQNPPNQTRKKEPKKSLKSLNSKNVGRGKKSKLKNKLVKIPIFRQPIFVCLNLKILILILYLKQLTNDKVRMIRRKRGEETCAAPLKE